MNRNTLTWLAGIALLAWASSSAAVELSEEVLAKKKEGWYPTGVPIVLYNSDDGFGYGARVLFFNNGKREDKYFKNTPYFYSITVQGYATTLGWQYHFIEADMPYFLGTKFRIRTSVVYDKSLNSNFFGIGGAANSKFVDRDGNQYDTYADYHDEFLLATPDDCGRENCEYYNFKYDKFTILRPKFFLNVYRDVLAAGKVMAGVEFKHADVMPWDGETFTIKGVEYVSGPTRLATLPGNPAQDYDGWVNQLRLGLGYDTRDFEPDPTRGVYLEYTLSVGTRFLGSDFDFTRSTLGGRYYVTPVRHLTLAFRLAYTTTTGDIPFHEMGYFAYLLQTQSALGNNRTLRGYKSNRFIGDTMTNGNAELRWQFADVAFAGQTFAFKIQTQCDVGSVFDKALDPLTQWDDYHVGFGGGLIVAWNQSFIVHFIYGRSSEDSSMSIDVNYAF